MKRGSAVACRTTISLLTATLLLIGILSSCGRAQDSDEYLKTLATDLKARTVPPGSGSLSESAVVRTQWSLGVAWEFETEKDWRDYSEWVRTRLESDFEALDHQGTELVFTRHLNGDAQTLVIQKVEASRNLRVRVTLKSYPD